MNNSIFGKRFEMSKVILLFYFNLLASSLYAAMKYKEKDCADTARTCHSALASSHAAGNRPNADGITNATRALRGDKVAHTGCLPLPADALKPEGRLMTATKELVA